MGNESTRIRLNQSASGEDGHAARDTHPGLTRKESTEVERRTPLRALVVYETIRREGEEELRRSTSALFWSALAAGLSMGFSLVAEGLLQTYLPAAPWRPLIARLGYSVGFLIVILGRQQLFTENTLTAMLPLFARRTMDVLYQVARLWIVVFAGNFLGAVMFAWLAHGTPVFEPEVKATFLAMGQEALAADFGTILLRGIFAGWLIALMVWLLPMAEPARVHVVVIITWLVGVAGLAHIVVGSVKSAYVVMNGAASWEQALGGFVLPALLGNTIGGVALVAALNHAQATAGESEAAPPEA